MTELEARKFMRNLGSKYKIEPATSIYIGNRWNDLMESGLISDAQFQYFCDDIEELLKPMAN